MPATKGSLPLGMERLPLQQYRSGTEVKINVPDNSVVGVPMNDYVVVDNHADNPFTYLESVGAGTCVNISIHSADKTLLAHMSEDTNAQGIGTRADKNLHEILTEMLNLVSEDLSQIDAIGLTSGLDFIEGKTRHSNEVLDDLMARDALNCEIKVIRTNDMIVNVGTGEMYGCSQQSSDAKFVNMANNRFDGYPNGTDDGKILDLVSNDNSNEAAQSASNQPTENENNPGNDGSGQENDGSDDAPNMDNSSGSDSGDSANTGAGEMGGGGIDSQGGMENPVEEGV